MKYEIINSSSKGNAVLYYNGMILVDVGIPYKDLADKIINTKIILLTHIHNDHFDSHAISSICKMRPDIFWIVPYYLQDDFELVKSEHTKYILVDIDKKYKINDLSIETCHLYHDVPNIGYKLIYDNYKIIHATDTGRIDHITAKHFDLYAIEFNHDEDEILKDIVRKKVLKVFAYEVRSKDTHLSFQKAISWIKSQMKETSEVLMLHISKSYLGE